MFTVLTIVSLVAPLALAAVVYALFVRRVLPRLERTAGPPAPVVSVLVGAERATDAIPAAERRQAA